GRRSTRMVGRMLAAPRSQAPANLPHLPQYATICPSAAGSWAGAAPQACDPGSEDERMARSLIDGLPEYEDFQLPHDPARRLDPERLAVLDSIQRRVLWLATHIIHHANHVRPNSDGVKVGGHQASSASVVSILTALYFHALQRGDRVSIKP